MNYRTNNYGNSYYEGTNNAKLGYSNVSKGFGYSNRNANNEDHNLGEMEFMLENQRRKFKEVKEKFQYDLDSERKLRIQFENKLIKLKEEFSRKDVTISELEFKINNLLHQNQDIVVENERLKHELARLEELYGGKIHQLQSQLAMETHNFEETTVQYNSQFEKFKKEGQDYVEQLTFEFQRKIKGLEERSKAAENTKRELAMQNKKLNDILISNKLAFEEEVRDVKNKARDEQIKKSQYLTKTFDQKVKMIEESKETLLRKNQELLRALQDKDRSLSDLEGEKNEQTNKLRQDNADMHQQMTHLNYLLGKLKNELTEKDSLIGRSLNDNDGQLQALRQQVESKKQQNAQLASTLRQLRVSLKESEGQWERRRRELTERANMMQGQARKYKDEYLRICDLLKSKINNAIDGVSYKK